MQSVEVIIRSFAMIREAMGNSRIVIEVNQDCTLSKALKVFAEKYSMTDIYLFQNGQVLKNIMIAINGEKITFDQYTKVQLSPNDEITIVPPAGGG